jgi:tetratricopeptide (TPR) repeat protein
MITRSSLILALALCTAILPPATLAQVKPATEGPPLKNDDEYLCVSTGGPQVIPACDRYIKTNPPPDKLITALRQRGQAHLYDRDDFVAALADYEAALKIDPNNAATHEYIGNLYSRKSDYAKAESSFNKVVELAPFYTSGYAGRAGIYIAMKDYDRALADLDKVVAINAKNESNKDWSYSVAIGYADRCQLRGLRGEYDLALEDCNKALSFEPTYDSALVNRGEIYTYKKDFTRALADLNAAVETGFEYPGKFKARAKLFESMGEKAKAIQDYKRAIELRGLRVDELAALQKRIEVLEKGGDDAATAGLDMTGHRLALLVGNKSYTQKVGALKNPHDDVNLLEAALKRLGFTVKVLKDADYRSMDTALKRYVREVDRAGPDTISFFYYSGHGVANPETKINYLIPIDVTEPEDEKIWDEAFQQNVIIDLLSTQAPKATHFVVFDACRNELHISGPASKALGADKGFVPVSATPGILIAYATAPNRTASDTGEGGGTYAKALAQEIMKPDVEAVSMFRAVQIRVKQSIDQDPWLSFPSLPEIYLGGRHSPGVP